MKTSAKILLLLVSCVSMFTSACKKDEKTPLPISFDQIALTDITAHDAEFGGQTTGTPIFYDNAAEARNFKVGSILFLKAYFPSLHYAKLEVTSVSSSLLTFNYMAYNSDGSVLVTKESVTISTGVNTFASWTGGFDTDPANCSISLVPNPITITTTAFNHHIIVFRL
jgi:hypothetical protein